MAKLRYKINYGGFKHNFHSLKILDVIETKYENEKGLNLTWQVLEGILKHTKIKKRKKTWDLNRFVNNENFFLQFIPSDCRFNNPINPINLRAYSILQSSLFGLQQNTISQHSLTLEGQIVNIADEIAQRQHDLDDGLRDLELRIKESDVLDHLSKIIDKIIMDVIKERIFDQNSLKKLAYEIVNNIKKIRQIISNEEESIFLVYYLEKITKDIKGKSSIEASTIVEFYLSTSKKKLIIDLVLNYYTEILDDDIVLLLDLKDSLHDFSNNTDSLKWKNTIRNVISYFIHDVTLNTIKSISNEKSLLYSK